MTSKRLIDGGLRTLMSAMALCMAGITGPHLVSAQTAEIHGSLGSYKVLNDACTSCASSKQ